MTKKNRGASRGVELTDELIEKLSKEAEAGYDVRKLVRRRGRPPMGSAAATIFQVRLEPELREALERRAVAEGTTTSEMARRLLRLQLGSKTKR